jgi:signal transduction histidine kinase
VDGVMHRLDYADTGGLRGFAKIARDATEQRNTEEALRHARDEMEQRVVERTADLLASKNDVEQAMALRQELERELLEISEREKRRVGEDLHDMVCQELTATALFLKTQSKVLEHDSPPASQTLSEAAQIVNRNVGLARDLARGLQPAELGSVGLTNALRDLAAHTTANHNLKCRLKTPRTIRIKDQAIGLNLYRIAQEAVTNAIKHAEAKEVIICLERIGGKIRLVIEDDGKGMRAVRTKKGKGLGVHIMKYRANVLGGHIEIEPRAKGGTKITCEVPVKG